MSEGGEEMGSKAHSAEERGAGESLEPLVASWPSWSLCPPAGARPQLSWLGTREDLLKPVQPARRAWTTSKKSEPPRQRATEAFKWFFWWLLSRASCCLTTAFFQTSLPWFLKIEFFLVTEVIHVHCKLQTNLKKIKIPSGPTVR